MENKLKEVRRRSGVTQIELAQRSGVPRNRIQMAESGLCDLREEEVRAVRAVLRPQLARSTKLLESELMSAPMESDTPKMSPSQTQRPDDKESTE